jgi:Subtilisin inhibitor-like
MPGTLIQKKCAIGWPTPSHKEEKLMNVVTRMGSLAAALVAGVVAFGAAPAPAQAASATPSTVLLLTVVSDEGSDGAARVATLQCSPEGGTHRAPAAACGALHAASGDFQALASEDGFCTKEYRPVTAYAAGQWQGQPVAYHATFGNPCLLLNATGPVFDF